MNEKELIRQGKILLENNRISEAYDYLTLFMSENLDTNKPTILLTGYYEGCDGNWHSYDDSCGDGGGTGGDGGCCELLAYILFCGGCCGCLNWCAYGNW